MTFEQPYKFKGGTSAKAQEVNANFNSVGQYFEGIENIQSNMLNSINNLEQDKADIHGSSQEQFNVAPAISNYNAVPLIQLNDFLYIIKGIIRGFTLSVYTTTRGNWGLTMAPGACFDSTENYLIKNVGNVNSSFDGQITMPGATYKIAVIADTNNSNSTSIAVYSGTSPTISLTQIYRQIAIVTTSSTGFGTITYVNGRIV